MNEKHKAKWTVLIYANGNNELEPEIYQILQDACKPDYLGDLNLLIEIGREDRQCVRILRPAELIANTSDAWCGVRRYCISNHNAQLLENLGNQNMADPMRLCEFINWGMEKFPAEHIMLVLEGHGASFIGVMTDYSQTCPYIMGTAEMCKAIQTGSTNAHKKIDILVLDMCYMNYIEVLFELGKEPANAVQHLLTYIEEGPFKGLQFDHMLSLLQQNSSIESTEEILRLLIADMPYNLVAARIEHNKLGKIKNFFSNAAYNYLKEGKALVKPEKLLITCNSEFSWCRYTRQINKHLSSLIIDYKYYSHDKKDNTSQETKDQHSAAIPDRVINVVTTELGDLLPAYYKLSFSRNNYWTKLICGESALKYNNSYIRVGFEPSAITKDAMIVLILSSNPSISWGNAKKILNRLCKYKKWL